MHETYIGDKEKQKGKRHGRHDNGDKKRDGGKKRIGRQKKRE